MRQDVVHNLARALQGVVSRRVGVALGVWGEPGIGKTWTAQQILRDLSCSGLSLHATVPDSALLGALPRPRKLPAWADAQLERLKNGEYLEPKTVLNTLTAVLRGLAPFVLHLEDLHECNPERKNLIVGLAQAVQHARGVQVVRNRPNLSATIGSSRWLRPKPALCSRMNWAQSCRLKHCAGSRLEREEIRCLRPQGLGAVFKHRGRSIRHRLTLRMLWHWKRMGRSRGLVKRYGGLPNNTACWEISKMPNA